MGLLRASKTVHGEASSVFYGQNRFDLTGDDPEKLASFLQQIGSHNAGYIRHIIIDFPEFLYLDSGDVTIDERSDSILANIQSSCANLSALTTTLYSTNTMELRLDHLDHPKVATAALKLVDTRFRAISSITEIILEVYEDGPSDHLRRSMESYGWTLIRIIYVEEEDWDTRFSDVDYNDYGYDFDDGGYDDGEYDFDNDSDFWRRAAD